MRYFLILLILCGGVGCSKENTIKYKDDGYFLRQDCALGGFEYSVCHLFSAKMDNCTLKYSVVDVFQTRNRKDAEDYLKKVEEVK